VVNDESNTAEQSALTPESVKALADKVIEQQFVPKKIPDIDDIDAQTKALGGALASALLTATEMPIHVLQPVVGDLAAQLVALGIRQTEHVDPDAVHAPAWITDGVRQESIKVPEQPQHTEAEPFVARVAEAPSPPKRIAKHARAVRQ
jgi:hypothetical protein